MDTPASTPKWPQLADAVSIGLILLDVGGRILHWNSWISRYSGLTLAHGQGRALEDVFGEAMPLPFRRAVANALTHHLPVVLSNVLHHAPLPLYARPEFKADDLRMPQSVTIMPVPQDDGSYLCMVQVTDTSVFARRERVLRSRSDRLSHEALVDGLTGVYNRKYFDAKLKMELERARRGKVPLSLVMFDVDNFKSYNDTYGHPAGDRVLMAIIDAVRPQVNRATDVLARYGGEEFAVVLPASDKNGAKLIAENMRRAVESLGIAHTGSAVLGCVTVSLGVACHDSRNDCSAQELLELADRALYDAKHRGRNRVQWTVSGPSPLVLDIADDLPEQPQSV